MASGNNKEQKKDFFLKGYIMTWQTTIYSGHFDSAIQTNAYVISYADLKFSKQFKVQKLGTINIKAQKIYWQASNGSKDMLWHRHVSDKLNSTT